MDNPNDRPAATCTQAAGIAAQVGQAARQAAGWRYTPHAIIFFSSACIMVVELVAGRLIARYLGSSLYTWTAIIGIVLAGMSVGNYVGGRMADWFRPKALLGWLFMAASMTCLAALATNRYLAHLAENEGLAGMSWVQRIFLSVLAVFLPPALALGTISPVTAKMALERSRALGTTIGSVYAWGAVGSIVGTFATGFWLIAALGAKGVILSVAAGLAVIGLLMGPRRWLHVAWITVIAVILIFSHGRNERVRQIGKWLGLVEPHQHLFGADSNYQYVRVDPDPEAGSESFRVLYLDYLIHGYVELTDPSYLHYEYERVYRDVALRYAAGKENVSTLFIGGGSYTFPRWVLSVWPKANVEVAEIDPMVVQANHKALGLAHDTPIKTYVGDARNVIDDLPKGRKYDLIFGDAFNDLSVPFHLTTLEFNRKLAGHLTEDGAYLVNVVDSYRHGRLLGAYVLTLQQVFDHVTVFCTEEESLSDDDAGRDTFVIAASNAPLDVTDWLEGYEDLKGYVLAEQHLASLAGKCRGRILTDDDAPVENLLAPVVRERE